MWLVVWFEHLVFTIVVTVLVTAWYNHGAWGVSQTIVRALQCLPGVEGLIEWVLHGEAVKFVKQNALAPGEKIVARSERAVIPKKGVAAEVLLKEMEKMKSHETEQSYLFAYTYSQEDEQFKLQKEIWEKLQDKCDVSADHAAISKEFFNAFLHENGLNPMAFPSLRRMETEIISMTATMLHGDEHVVGFHTSGGTESILMAVKTYRDRARKLFPSITKPNMIAPETIHPCMEKACHYFDVEMIHAPLQRDYRVDVEAMEQLITPNTIMLAASAPQFPHGLVDPIEEVSQVALRRGLPLHIDSCFGGFMLPWVEKLGYPVPKFDFRCPGVTSISADAHKWGYCTKGSSVILYRNDQYRKHQIFSYSAWCGGLYGSPSMAGTRPAGNIASTWATMRFLGEEGFMNMAKQLMDTTRKLMDRVKEAPGLAVISKPVMNAFAITSNDPDVNIQAVADCMEKKGFKIERQSNPECFHISVLPHHIAIVDKVADSIIDSAKQVKANKRLAKEGTAAVYGMMAVIPDKAIISDFIVEFFSQIYR